MKKKYIFPIVLVITYLLSFVFMMVHIFSEPPVGWSKKDFKSVETVIPFNQRCVFCTNYYSDNSDFIAASKLLHEETGIQLYLVDLDVNCTENKIFDEQEANQYMLKYIEDNIETSNAIVIYSMYQSDDALYDESGEKVWVSLYDLLYVGDVANSVLTGEAYSIFSNSLEAMRWNYSQTQYTDTVKLFLNHTLYADAYRLKRTVVSLLFFVIPIALTIVYIGRKRAIRKHEETVEILSTPLEKLSESDELLDKYLNE